MVSEKVKKRSKFESYVWVLLQAHSWGKLKNLWPSISRTRQGYGIILTKCAKKATSSSSNNVFLRQSARATTASGSYNLRKPDTRISNSDEKHREHWGQDNANNECQKYK